jgi:hypothetical protein
MKTTNFYKLLFAALFVLGVTPAFSQFSAGLEIGLPQGNWADAVATGFGASLRYEAPIQDKLNWTASAGYLSFGSKDLGGGYKGTGSVVPIVGGVKYYFTEANAGFYVGADLGFYMASFKLENSGVSASSSKTYFGIAPGVGYRVSQFDFSFRYNSAGDASYMGLRAAYCFGGGK